MTELRADVTVEALNARSGEYLPGYLGVEIVELGPRSLRSRMPLKKLHLAPNAFLHAASIVALADTSCGYATFAHLPEGALSFTTIELKTNHLGTVLDGALACRASAQHIGRSTQVWDAVVTDEASDRTIALFRCTQMILWPKETRPEARRLRPAATR